MLLVAVAFMVLLALPLMKSASDYNRLRIRRQACASILEASLPAAYQAVSADALSLGRLSLDPVLARTRIEALLLSNMASARLDARLQSLTIGFSASSRPEASGHWLNGSRPDTMPVISSSAEWLFPDGWTCRVEDRIELVLD